VVKPVRRYVRTGRSIFIAMRRMRNWFNWLAISTIGIRFRCNCAMTAGGLLKSCSALAITNIVFWWTTGPRLILMPWGKPAMS